MAHMTNYLEAKVHDHVLGITAFPMPTGMHLALFTAAPTEAGGGTEVTGGGYARKAIAFAAGAAGANSTAVSFVATGAPFGTIVAWGLFDAATLGNLLIYFPIPLANQREYLDGDTVDVPIGALTITAD